MGERRWLIIAGDGRHVTVGRHTDPSPAEIERAETQLDAMATDGWLVVSEGIYHSDEPITLLMVRRVAGEAGTWEEAERLWHEIRERRAVSG